MAGRAEGLESLHRLAPSRQHRTRHIGAVACGSLCSVLQHLASVCVLRCARSVITMWALPGKGSRGLPIKKCYRDHYSERDHCSNLTPPPKVEPPHLSCVYITEHINQPDAEACDGQASEILLILPMVANH